MKAEDRAWVPEFMSSTLCRADSLQCTLVICNLYEDGLSLPFGWTPRKKRNGFPVPLVRADTGWGRAPSRRVNDGSQRGKDALPQTHKERKKK